MTPYTPALWLQCLERHHAHWATHAVFYPEGNSPLSRYVLAYHDIAQQALRDTTATNKDHQHPVKRQAMQILARIQHQHGPLGEGAVARLRTVLANSDFRPLSPTYSIPNAEHVLLGIKDLIDYQASLTRLDLCRHLPLISLEPIVGKPPAIP